MFLSDLWREAAGASAGQLAPFFKCVLVYTAAAACGGGGGPRAPPAALAAAKAAPVLCLAALVYMARDRVQRGARLIALGLVLSAVGDALLVWEGALLGGMAAFACAHAAYIAAWGLSPLALPLGIILQVAAGLWAWRLQTPPALTLPTRAYAAILAASAWRAAARAWAGGAGRGRGRRWAAAGGALFLTSDAALGYGMFNEPLPYQQAVVMSTYYAAQLCIALGALQPPPPPAPSAPPAHAGKQE